MSNVNKPVIIPAEVADAIERLREDCAFTNWSFIELISNDSPKIHQRAHARLRSIRFDTLLAALINGYERELTGGRACTLRNQT